jgi:hypothetical protein
MGDDDDDGRYAHIFFVPSTLLTGSLSREISFWSLCGYKGVRTETVNLCESALVEFDSRAHVGLRPLHTSTLVACQRTCPRSDTERSMAGG